MLSVPDLAIVGAVALLVFGPEQLPKIARKVGHVMRDVQSTSQHFMREMERAADETDIGAVPITHATDAVSAPWVPEPQATLEASDAPRALYAEGQMPGTRPPEVPLANGRATKPASEPSEF